MNKLANQSMKHLAKYGPFEYIRVMFARGTCIVTDCEKASADGYPPMCDEHWEMAPESLVKAIREAEADNPTASPLTRKYLLAMYHARQYTDARYPPTSKE